MWRIWKDRRLHLKGTYIHFIIYPVLTSRSKTKYQIYDGNKSNRAKRKRAHNMNVNLLHLIGIIGSIFDCTSNYFLYLYMSLCIKNLSTPLAVHISVPKVALTTCQDTQISTNIGHKTSFDKGN